MGAGSGGNFGNTKGHRSRSSKDSHLYGKPGQIRRSGYKKTYIGSDGRAIKEIHYTDHGNPKNHTNPHEHIIKWDKNGNPIFKIRMAILYLKKDKKRGLFMKYDNNFNNAHDLVDCLKRGCEVEFLYNNKKYSITHADEGISVIEFYNEDSEKTYSDAKKVLEYEIDGKLLKDIISEMKIIDRSF